MALYGAVAEGWSYAGAGATPGPRYGDTLFRGSLSVTGSATVTLPLPIRFVGFPQATVSVAAAGSDPTFVSVGNITKASFTIYLWKPASGTATNLIASTTATTVYWTAYGSITDNFVSGAY